MNRSTETTAPDHSARIARAAWLCAFVVPLLLATLLLGVNSAQAAPSPPPLAPLVVFDEEEEFEGEEESEFAEEECAIAYEELEEGLLTEADVVELCTEAEEATSGASSKTSNECPIRSIRAHAVQHNNRLKLTIGYTTNDPVKATFSVRKVGTFKRRLGRSGVIRITRKLGEKQVKRIKVRIRVPSSAGGRGCGLVQVVANKIV